MLLAPVVAHGGNQTPAAYAASEHLIHYAIASRALRAKSHGPWSRVNIALGNMLQPSTE